MSNVIPFPAPLAFARQITTESNENAQPVIGFRADLYVENGRDLGYCLTYPGGYKPSRGLMAAMLRQAAKHIEETPPLV